MEQTSGKRSWLQHPIIKEYGPEEHIPWYLWLFKNRFSRFVIFGWTVLTTTCVYYGWQNLSIMLFRANYYDYKCDGQELLGEAYKCQAQYQAVQSLYIVCLASEFSGSSPAGFLFDYLGPLATGSCGMVMFFVGWIMLIYSSQSVPMYFPAMILNTGAVNLIAFPSLVLGDLFPRNQGFNLAYVVAAQTGATAVAPTLQAIWDLHPSWTFTSLMWGYLLFLGLPTCGLFLLSLPISRHEVLRLNPLKKNVNKGDELVEIAPVELRNPVESQSIYGGFEDEDEGVELVPLTDAPSRNREQLDSISLAKMDICADLAKEGSTSEKASWRNLLQEMVTIEWMMFCLYYCIQVLQYGYYPTTVLEQFGDDPSNVLGYLMPVQAVIGIVMGVVVDYTTTLPICMFINTMNLMVYVLALIQVVKLQYLTSVLFVLGVAFIYTTKYTYAAEAFKPDNFGMLVGIIGFLSGILTLILIPIKDTNQYKIICISFAVLSGVVYLILIYLWIRLKKIKRSRAAEKQDLSIEATEERSAFIA